MNKPAITFYMQAYNTEKYIEKAIESVLNQTLDNIELILLDNGSTDRTREITQYYAKNDKRVIYLKNDYNSVLYPEYKGIDIDEYVKGEYFSTIDSDDFLDPTYAEELYKVAKENNSDIVISGTKMFVDERRNMKKIPPKVSLDDKEDLSDKFINLYGMIRQFWAKLYKSEIYFDKKNKDFLWEKPKDVVSATDTFVVLRYLYLCNSIASVDKALHNYRIHEESIYHSSIDKTRALESKYIYDEGIKLLDKWGIKSQKLIEFLQDVHLVSMSDSLKNAVNNKDASIGKKLELIQTVVQDNLFCSYMLSDRNRQVGFETISTCVSEILGSKGLIDIAKEGDFFIARMNYILDNQEQYGEGDLAALILSVLCDPNNINNWGYNLIDKIKNLQSNLFNKIFMNHFESLLDLLSYPKLIRHLINSDYKILRNYLESNEFDVVNKKEIIKLIDVLRDEKVIDDFVSDKESLINYIEKNDFESAIEVLMKILSFRVLDKEGIYFKILIAWNIGDQELALYTSQIARVFWYDDDDMMALCGDVFSAIGAKKCASDCYNKSIKVSNNSELIIDLQERIVELSN